MNTFRFQRAKLLKVSLVAAAMLAACLPRLVVRVAPCRATFPGLNGKIAFTSAGDGNAEIYTMNPDGTDQTSISGNTGNAFDPERSPEGTKIAFQSIIVDEFGDETSEIYSVNPDGSNLTDISNNAACDSDPAWQPLPGPTVQKTTAECKKGAYKAFCFKNQGRYIALVNRATRSE